MTTAYFYSACYVAAAHEAAFEKQGALTNRVMTLIVLHLIGTWVYSTGFCMLRFTSTCLPQRMTNHHALCSRHTSDKDTKQRSPLAHGQSHVGSPRIDRVIELPQHDNPNLRAPRSRQSRRESFFLMVQPLQDFGPQSRTYRRYYLPRQF